MNRQAFTRNCIREEIWKAFHNRWFGISAAMGIGIAVLGIVHNTRFLNSVIENIRWCAENDIPVSSSLEGASLFTAWIAADAMGYAAGLLYLIWPLLCALPYGYSTAQEWRNGVAGQIQIRCGRQAYLAGKFIALFLSGGVAFAIPVVTNLLGNALICPDNLPCVAERMVMISNQNFLSELYYTHPWAFALAWCGVDFLFGGVGACLSLVCSVRCRFPLLAAVLPFGILYAVNYLLAFVQTSFAEIYMLSPLLMPKASTYLHNPGWILLTAAVCLAAMGFAGGYFQVVKHENL